MQGELKPGGNSWPAAEETVAGPRGSKREGWLVEMAEDDMKIGGQSSYDLGWGTMRR